ncbi:MAG: hypothetical protein ACOCPR_04895 [Guyparkeria sp.]
MSTPRTETKARFAERLGVHRSTITRAAKQGRIVCDLQGRVLVEDSLQRWHDTAGPRTDMQAAHAQRRGQPIPGAGSAQSGGHSSGHDHDTATGLPATALIDAEGERARWQAHTLHWTNSRTRLDIELDLRKRVMIDDVTRAAEAMGGAARSGIERLVDELAPRLTVTTDPAERRDLLAAGLHQLTDRLRDEHRRAIDRLRKPQ